MYCLRIFTNTTPSSLYNDTRTSTLRHPNTSNITMSTAMIATVPRVRSTRSSLPVPKAKENIQPVKAVKSFSVTSGLPQKTGAAPTCRGASVSASVTATRRTVSTGLKEITNKLIGAFLDRPSVN